MAFLRVFSVFAGIAVFTWLGFSFFPGHTYLRSETQIYLPLLERIEDPGFLARDIVAVRPNIAFTIYDEVTLTARKVHRFDFENLLVSQQLLFRAAGMLGVILLATSIGIPPTYGLLIAAFWSMGAYLAGPALATVECEPIPRTFAFGLVILALGFLSHRRPLPSGLAAGLAFLYHPITALPFWGIVFLGVALDRRARRLWKPMPIIFFIAVLLLANLAQLQPNMIEPQTFFSRLSGNLMQLQRFRTSYAYVSTWAPAQIWHYLALCICALWATSRIWTGLEREIRWFFIWLPIGGVLSIPFSYLTLEQLHLAAIPEIQPARVLLYTVAITSVATGLAAIKAARSKRIYEAIAWFLLVATVPVNVQVFQLAAPSRSHLEILAAVIVIAILAAGLVIVCDGKQLRAVPLIVPIAAFLALPLMAHIRPCRDIDKGSIAEVARWAKDNTWGSSMFLFPDQGRSAYPGVFRALSERALYVDWVSGIQVTHFEAFAEEWYPRFEQTMEGKFTAGRLEDMLALPVDYYVLKHAHALVGIAPVFSSKDYAVYDAQDLRNASTSLRLGTDD